MIKIKFLVQFLVMFVTVNRVESSCKQKCVALASYQMLNQSDLTFLSKIFSTTIPHILSYNPQITNQDIIPAGSRTNVPFSCACDDQDFLSHRFVYNVSSGTTYSLIADTYFMRLTTVDMLRRFNSFNELNLVPGSQVNVVVNCSCGDGLVSKDYGLFITYPIRSGENLSTIANETGVNENHLRGYNPGSSFLTNDLVFVPGRDQNGTFPPLKISTKGLSGGATAGISVGAVAGVLFFAICFYFVFYRRKRVAEGSLLLENGSEHVHGRNLGRTTNSDPLVGGAPGVTGITVDKSVEFAYEELAKATDDFSLTNKIGQGGFGAVYYGELRGEVRKAAIKKMDMQASKEFLAELKVRLIGYCVEGSLFLVYEFIGNGNLNQYLRDSSGRVADFGLTKLTEVGSGSLQTRLVGTFGYMPPEYAQYGEVSPKVDVYAFGVVLFELISAKEAIVKTNEFGNESKGLVGLFEEALSLSEPSEGLRKLVDPRLGAEYPLDSVRKVALLARACTHENPHLRPSMRSIVVALMTLSSSTEDWDIGSFYENQDLVQLMSGR
ncbi:hypothetical protein L1987_03518 [Smallanthus sonchifolius]|uniref:Uncharacterized protein n=1 Tax=Smallanthus sonchifolius TaxID=185202 RepID=A0ACB9KAT7_9ASTR|nr:hypothetical protein L1987_03518 [Smallanthus sonchifolius]